MQACSVWRIPVRILMDVSSLLLVLLHLILVRCRLYIHIRHDRTLKSICLYSNTNFFSFSFIFHAHTHTHTTRSDGKHTVFGQVLDDASMLTVRKCEAVPVNGSVPRLPLTITQCGEL
jgi:hypothetical protein